MGASFAFFGKGSAAVFAPQYSKMLFEIPFQFSGQWDTRSCTVSDNYVNPI
jgi:hypothetical protein